MHLRNCNNSEFFKKDPKNLGCGSTVLAHCKTNFGSEIQAVAHQKFHARGCVFAENGKQRKQPKNTRCAPNLAGKKVGRIERAYCIAHHTIKHTHMLAHMWSECEEMN